MELISAIFPIYKKWDLIHKRLWELAPLVAPYHIQVVLADDFSEDKQVEAGLKWWSKAGVFRNIKIISNEKNLGFGGNLNNAVDKCDGEILILHSTDVQINGDYIKEILTKLKENPDALVGGRLLDYDTGWNKFGDKLFPYLEGWMICCKRDTWKKLGGFHPMYYPYDYEDLHLSTQALEMGIELVPLNSPHLLHSGGATIYSVHGVEKRREVTERNKIKFEDYWVKGNRG